MNSALHRHPIGLSWLWRRYPVLGRYFKGVMLVLVCGLTSVGTVAPSYGQAVDQNDIQAISLLIQRDFSSLESKFGDLLSRYKSGKISDEPVYNAFDKLAETTDDGQEANFDEWVRKYPKSYVALTARGYFLRAKAGRIRGGKYASQTTSEEFAGFKEYLAKARADLVKSIELDDRPTLSYLRQITIAGSLEGPIEARTARDRALKFDPQSYIAHRIYLKYATPKWGGSSDIMEAARTDAMAAKMTDQDKKRYQAVYDFMLGDETERMDRASEALTLYWKAYQEGAENEGLTPLEKGAWLANRVRRFELAMKFLDEMIAIRKGSTVWARNTRGYIRETQFNQLEKAFDDYSVSAGMGDAWAENKLGWWYANGIYVTKDTEMARKYLQRAAQKGNQNAVKNLQSLDRKTTPSASE